MGFYEKFITANTNEAVRYARS